MTVETNANFISDFNKAYPRNKDLIKEGDDHIRLIKSVMQNTFPGMNGAVTAGTDKLNKLDSTFSFDGEELTIKSDIIIPEDTSLDFGENILSNIGDPKEPTDAINLRSLQGSLMWPIGSIFMTVDSRNPKEILGFGTWAKFAQGRMIVGTGTAVDENNETRTFINEGTGGSYRARLTEDNLPEHSHESGDLKTVEDGAHDHDVDLRVHSYAYTNNNIWTAPLGEIAGESKRFTTTDGARTKRSSGHTHGVEGKTGVTGKGAHFDINQPYIGCNIWVRNPDPEE